ncbi:unknown [Eubacterium sp. CAG:786]|nr:unknown [Eubacterium sp. CAG:786]
MKEKTKSVILIVVIVLLAIWLAVESFLVGILIDWYRKSTYEVIDGDILELQTRVTALENGTTLADELAKLEVNTSESSAQPQE